VSTGAAVFKVVMYFFWRTIYFACTFVALMCFFRAEQKQSRFSAVYPLLAAVCYGAGLDSTRRCHKFMEELRKETKELK
jgi:hypothetical protein